MGGQAARRPCKRVGQQLYTHRPYETQVVPDYLLANAKELTGSRIDGYTCVRYDVDTKDVAFQFSPDFDTADEPTVRYHDGSVVGHSAEGGPTNLAPQMDVAYGRLSRLRR